MSLSWSSRSIGDPVVAMVLAVGAVLVGGYFLLPAGAGQDLGYAGIGTLATVVMGVSTWRRRPIDRLGWGLLTASNTLFVLGDGVYDVYDLILHRDAPFPSVADALYLAGYPLLFAGVARVTRLRSAAGAREAKADAAMVSLGGLAVSWHLLMGSYAHDKTLSALGKLVTLAYPIMDIGVLFIIVGAMMLRSARRPTDSLLGLAVAVMVVADFVYDLQVLHGNYVGGAPVDGLFLANYVLMAAAAAHPSVARPLPPTNGSQRGRVWLPLVAAAAFVSPGLLLACTLAHVQVDVPVLAAISLAISALAATRAAWLFGRLRQQTDELAAQASELAVQGTSLREALATRQALETDLRHQAFHDALTGLANRALLHDRVEHALAAASDAPETVALFFCDLDGFKAVNDGLGHQTGDALLAVVAQRISSIARASDTVARLGGDEFAVLVCDIDDTAAVTSLAERIVSVLRQPVAVDGQRVYVSASVGVAFAERGCTAERLLAEADAAMYAAKHGGKDRVAVFEAQMRARIVDRMLIANALKSSLRDGHFHLQYQPQLLLADSRLAGFEALVRWNHPTLGAIGPNRFVPVAEETGFIVELGRWVLRQACLEAARWARAGTPVPVSVNVSGRQLQHPDIRADVRDALIAADLPAHLLVLEITETVLMTDLAGTEAVLADLKRSGIRIAIDDFGTGYSSLSTLRHFPADILKIDKSFVDPLAADDSDARAFVQTILRLAADLNLDATAEGIELQEQRDLLVDLHCRSGQGFLMFRPLDPDAARALAWEHRGPGAETDGDGESAAPRRFSAAHHHAPHRSALPSGRGAVVARRSHSADGQHTPVRDGAES